MIKAILFDLDGTLINTNDLVIKSFQYAFKKHMNLEVAKEEIVKLFGEPLENSMKKYDPENFQVLIDSFREFNEKNHDDFAKAFDKVDIALKKLKSLGIKLAVVTSKKRNMAHRGLKLFNVYDYMDVIITPEDTSKHKPKAEPALKACKDLGVEPCETLMVGDSFNDILCGKGAGCYTCLVKYTLLSLEDVMKYNPDYVVDSIYDILDIVKK